jgi:alpha-galactosidase
MVDRMLVAGEKWLPQYKAAIGEAKARLAELPAAPAKRGYRGAARLKTRSIEEMQRHAEPVRDLGQPPPS